jgi:DNA-binding transcriptional ArsR family regulator
MSDDEIEECEKDQMCTSHDQYHVAVNHPIRKTILEALRERSLTLEEIAAKTNLTQEALSWHITILETGRLACIEKENKPKCVVYKLTQAGSVINYLE